MSAIPDRPLAPIVWCVDEVQQMWEQFRDTPPDPAIVAALRAVLAHGALAGIPNGGKPCRLFPSPDKEIRP